MFLKSSDFSRHLSTLGRAYWSGVETITVNANEWKDCTKSITLPPGFYMIVAHADLPAGTNNGGTIKIKNVPAIEAQQSFGHSSTPRRVNLTCFYSFNKEVELLLTIWCSAAVSIEGCEVCAMRLK